MYNNAEEYTKNCIKWRIHTKRKAKKRVKHIRTTKVYERYQADTVKLSQDLNINGKYKYLFTWIDHFSKFGFWIPLSDIKGPSIRLCISQVFINGEPEIFQTDNGTEFRNKDVEGYLEAKDIKFIHRRPYHPESQGAVETFNKTVQDYLLDCYENDKIDGIEWDLRLKLSGFLNLYNQKRKHTTTNKIPAEIFRKYDDPTIRKEVVMAKKQSRKRHLTQIDFEEGEIVLVTSLATSNLTKKKPYYCREKPPKGTKHQRKKRFNTKAKIERILHSVCYIKIVENIGPDEIHNIGEAYRVSYDCISKNC